MNIRKRLNNRETLIVTPKKDLKPSTAFPDTYIKGKKYLAEYHGPNTTKVHIPNGYHKYWTFFISDMEGFFIDLEQLRDEKLKELGL